MGRASWWIKDADVVHCAEEGEVCSALLLSLLVLLTPGLKQLAVGEKSLVGELGLVLELDPLPCLVV